MPLLGNHEEMLFSARSSHDMLGRWLAYGGAATLASYGSDDLHAMPQEHAAFLDTCRLYYETNTHFFIHANYDPNVPLGEQNEDTALSLSLFEHVPGLHFSRKTAIVGHTPQLDGQILDLGYLKCIDTHCYGRGCLTALDVNSGQIWARVARRARVRLSCDGRQSSIESRRKACADCKRPAIRMFRGCRFRIRRTAAAPRCKIA